MPYSWFRLVSFFCLFRFPRRSKQSRIRRRTLSSIRRCRSRAFFAMIVIQSQLFSHLSTGDIQPFNSKLEQGSFYGNYILANFGFSSFEIRSLHFILVLCVVLSFLRKYVGGPSCLGYPGEGPPSSFITLNCTSFPKRFSSILNFINADACIHAICLQETCIPAGKVSSLSVQSETAG